jgi:hypothetical protein
MQQRPTIVKRTTAAGGCFLIKLGGSCPKDFKMHVHVIRVREAAYNNKMCLVSWKVEPPKPLTNCMNAFPCALEQHTWFKCAGVNHKWHDETKQSLFKKKKPSCSILQSFSDPGISSDSDSDSAWSPKFGLGLGLGLKRNRDFPTPWPKIISQWNTYDVLTIVDICACG